MSPDASRSDPDPAPPPGAGWVRAVAPAKVNPWLEVLGRRDDGFHEVDLGMLAIDVCDVLDVRARDAASTGRGGGPGSVALAVTGPAAAGVPADASNLAVCAARAVLEEAQARGAPPRDVELRLFKRVPARAGLGGGSSDAAAAAVGTRAALGLDAAALPDARLAERLAGLGSDCVFFLLAAATGFARCKGRGERVEPLPVPSPTWSIVILAPAVECSTAAVYRALEFPLFGPPAASSFRPDLLEEGEADARSLLFNRLEPVALKTVPELRCWRETLDRAGAAHFRLSGSGSAWFGVYRDRDRAREDSNRLSAELARAGLALRGSWLTAPAAHGARVATADG